MIPFELFFTKIFPSLVQNSGAFGFKCNKLKIKFLKNSLVLLNAGFIVVDNICQVVKFALLTGIVNSRVFRSTS